SLLEALTMAPARSSQLLRVGRRATFVGRAFERAMDGLVSLYRRAVPGLVRWRYLVVLVGVGGFCASLLLLRGMDSELTPSEDQGISIARFVTPVGASIDATDATAKRIEGVLRARPAV